MDVIQKLRRLEFPDSAKTALIEISQCLTQNADKHIPGLGNDPEELAGDIVREFILFGEKKKLNALYELQVLEVMCNFGQKEENLKCTAVVFNFLFTGNLSELRQDILNKLVSMAVGMQCTPILDWASDWIQTQGSTSVKSMQLAYALVQDYCVLVPGTTVALHSLPDISVLFASSFLTAITAFYEKNNEAASNYQSLKFPYKLLQVITQWIHEDCTLCIKSLLQQVHSKDISTPIPGLAKYCVLSSCLEENDKDTNQADVELMYSKLHMSLLQTILKAKGSGITNISIFCSKDVQSIVNSFLHVQKNSKVLPESREYELALDRFAQILQVAMSTGTCQCSLEELQSICKPLQHTRLLEIVLKVQNRREAAMEH